MLLTAIIVGLRRSTSGSCWCR